MLSHLQSFKEFVAKRNLFRSSDTLLLAVSGGKDSVAMVHLFAMAGFRFVIAHCNFQLRGEEAERDEAFVKDLAEQYVVPFHVIRFDTQKFADENGISIQMAARQLRYSFFYDLVQQHHYSKTATAHHQNDAIETLFLNLIRGTRLAGLHGIKADGENLVRPLLCFTSADIADFVRIHSINYVEDSSNSSEKYTRNKIRHQILPVMREINPSLEDTLNRSIRHFTELELFVKQQMQQIEAEILEAIPQGYRIDKQKIRQLDSANFVLQSVLVPFGFNETTISDLLQGVFAESDSGKVFYSSSHRLNLDRDYVFLVAQSDVGAVNDVKIKPGQKEAHFDFYTIVMADEEKFDSRGSDWCFVDAEKLVFPLTVRNWQQGDRFMPFGMKGQKKLSDFFIGQKVPLTQKGQIPVLVNGDGKIIWVVGLRSDERFKVTHSTKKIITFEKRNKRA